MNTKRCVIVLGYIALTFFTMTKPGYGEKTPSIPDDLLQKCKVIAHTYLAQMRKWDVEDYKLSFRVGIHPQEVVLVIDIVDMVVLSENEPDTIFPNATR